MHNKTQLLIALTGLVAGSCALPDGCYDTSNPVNPEHCANNEGDQYCQENHPDRPYCNLGEGECLGGRIGCVEVPPEGECHAACGILDSDECTAEASSSSGTSTNTSTSTNTNTNTSTTGFETDTTTETETETTTGPMGCVDNSECTDAGTPLCIDEVCEPCGMAADGDAACVELDAASPVCGPAGACVTCTAAVPGACDGVTPVCNEGTFECEGCTEHEQCGTGDEGACHVAAEDPLLGACFPNAVFRVGDGQEFSTLAAAVEAVTASGEGIVVLHGSNNFDEDVVITDRSVFFRRTNGTTASWVQTNANDQPTLEVSGSAVVYLLEMELTGNLQASTAALLVDGAVMHVERSAIVGNNGGGIRAQGGATLSVVNSFVGGNASDVVAVETVASNANILYSTLAAGLGDSNALVCTTATGSVRNSLVVSRAVGPGISCDLGMTDSAVEAEIAGNTNVNEMETSWFVDFASGNFHLSGTAPIAISMAAQWQTGDPATDIDGAPRPNADGDSDYAGADIP